MLHSPGSSLQFGDYLKYGCRVTTGIMLILHLSIVVGFCLSLAVAFVLMHVPHSFDLFSFPLTVGPLMKSVVCSHGSLSLLFVMKVTSDGLSLCMQLSPRL
jgi:hypothetical protein